MPGVGDESIPLARVYDAMDAEAYRGFRAAMRRSRGGVVRAADLLAALAENRPHDAAAVLRLDPDEVAALARPPAGEPDLVPMANEARLREVLVTAYRRAEGGPITPAVLLSALATRPPGHAGAARPAAMPGPSRPALSGEWDGEWAADVLGHWLAAQSLPSGRREAEIAGIGPGAGEPGPTRP